jgi:ABC-type glycerol-3-phosphate transport system substrate-binding protein
MDRKLISRRQFIKAAGVAAGASILAACAPQQTAAPPTTAATSAPAPTTAPEPAVLDVWWNTDIPDIRALVDWKQDPENEFFQKNWNWGGLAYAKYIPFLDRHPGVDVKITTHSWDWDLRQNQLMGLAAGIIPDTTYGEAYVNEFVQLDVFSPVSAASAGLFAPGSVRGATKDGNVYGLPKSSGADVLFINLTLWEQAGLDRNAMPTTWDELVSACQAISEVNESDTWGNTCYYTYGPGGDSYGQAMRILHWFNQNNAPLGSDLGVPSANVPGAAETWVFHNDLMWSSTENLILQAESEAGSGKLFNDGVIAVKPGWNNDATSVGEGNVDAIAIPFPTPPGGQPATIVIGNDIESPLKGGKNPELGIALIEETVSDPAAQAWLANNAGIWIPALKSLLEQHENYDQLGGYKTDTAKVMVRVTMKTLLDGGAGPLPGWPKNGSRIWTAWNDMYGRIWKDKMDQAAIQAELDTLQTTIEGLVARTG